MHDRLEIRIQKLDQDSSFLKKTISRFHWFQIKNLPQALNISIEYLIICMRVVKILGNPSKKPLGIPIDNLGRVYVDGIPSAS